MKRGEDCTQVQDVVRLRMVGVKVGKSKTTRREEALWSKRASELLDIFDDDSRPSASGHFGSFLF